MDKASRIEGSFTKLSMSLALFCALFCFAPSLRAQGRIRPPGSIKCDPNHLTSFTGRVTNYQRTSTRVSLRMRTDEETTESFRLSFRRTEDAARWFLLVGKEFKRSDWALIERGRKSLRRGMRATVWVCDDGTNPIIDWRPGEGRTKTVY